MALLNLFSRRMKQQRGELPDVYVYDQLPDPLRVQLIHIWNHTIGAEIRRDADGDLVATPSHPVYLEAVRCLRKERHVLGPLIRTERKLGLREELWDYFLQESGLEHALDVVEIICCAITTIPTDRYGWGNWSEATGAHQQPADALEEINARFREHGVGYQFENSQVVRVDSKYLHAETIKPALALLTDSLFAGPNREFLSALAHYRARRHEEALTDALKAFESTMKVICDRRQWTYAAGATAKPLIAACFDKGLVPPAMETQFSSLRALLESGVPTLRNKNAGHGQGSTLRNVPAPLVAFALHLTASNIVFLVETDKALT